jgi:hypothetical protein
LIWAGLFFLQAICAGAVWLGASAFGLSGEDVAFFSAFGGSHIGSLILSGILIRQAIDESKRGAP